MKAIGSAKSRHRPQIAARIAAVAGLILAVFLLSAAEPPSSPDFAVYRGVKGFDLFLQTHAQHTGPRHSWTNLLVISTLQAEGRVAYEYFVGESGQCYSHRNRGMGWSNTKGTNLTDVQLSRVRTALRELPANNATPPIERLVLLSFQDGDRWVTRSFDFLDRPAALQTLFQLIGERPDEPVRSPQSPGP